MGYGLKRIGTYLFQNWGNTYKLGYTHRHKSGGLGALAP